MSQTQYAFMKKSNIPSQKEWQKAIDELQFDIHLQLDSDLVPFNDSGFSPCKWGNTDHDVGFEIDYEPSVDVFGNDSEFERLAGEGNDYCISFCWRGNMKDCAAVLIASCALANSFGAIVSYEGEFPEPISKQLESARSVILKAKTELP